MSSEVCMNKDMCKARQPDHTYQWKCEPKRNWRLW